MKEWQRHERLACERLGAEHVGGSGGPDCVGQDYVAEVKAYGGRPVDRSILRRTHQRPWVGDTPLRFVSRSGYTAGAIEYAEAHAILLYKFGDDDELHALGDADFSAPDDADPDDFDAFDDEPPAEASWETGLACGMVAIGVVYFGAQVLAGLAKYRARR